MTNRMIMSSNDGLTFMYRVGGIAVHDEHLLVERNVMHGFCFVPGGRVEYGENAMEALAREVREELSEEVETGRLILVADNLFELDGHRFQEIALYFLIGFRRGSKILDRDGVSEGTNREPRSSGHHWTRWEKANLLPAFLRERVRAIPQTPEYVVSDF